MLTPGDIGTTLSLIVTATGRGGAADGDGTDDGADRGRARSRRRSPVPQPCSRAPRAPSSPPTGGRPSRGSPVRCRAAPPSRSLPPTAASGSPARGRRSTSSLRRRRFPGRSTSRMPPRRQTRWSASRRDGRIWMPVAALTEHDAARRHSTRARTTAGAVLHVLTPQAGRFALFAPGAWGDPSASRAAAGHRAARARQGDRRPERHAAARHAPLRQLAVGSLRERVRPGALRPRSSRAARGWRSRSTAPRRRPSTPASSPPVAFPVQLRIDRARARAADATTGSASPRSTRGDAAPRSCSASARS